MSRIVCILPGVNISDTYTYARVPKYPPSALAVSLSCCLLVYGVSLVCCYVCTGGTCTCSRNSLKVFRAEEARHTDQRSVRPPSLYPTLSNQSMPRRAEASASSLDPLPSRFSCRKEFYIYLRVPRDSPQRCCLILSVYQSVHVCLSLFLYLRLSAAVACNGTCADMPGRRSLFKGRRRREREGAGRLKDRGRRGLL